MRIFPMIDETDESDGEPAIDLRRLATVLCKTGVKDIDQADSRVGATKLGETYRVDRRGKVVEGGARREAPGVFNQDELS